MKLKSLILILFTPFLSSSTYAQQTKSIVVNSEIQSIFGSKFISGVYPHLTTYSHGRENGKYGFGNECGIGALAVWNGKLYMVNYAAHEPKGSEHKLYIVDKDKNMTLFQGSIGGTPAARMIHKESNQLFIGSYVIDSTGNIRVIPVKDMPGRLTAIARHLIDPANLVYYYDMEGMLYEVNVHTLAVRKLYNNPLPGWHGKGAYTSQGKLILANNGEAPGEKSNEWQVNKVGMIGGEKFGILAEYDGAKFKVVERKQYTDLTTRNGINAVPNEQSPLWALGWDKRSVRLKVLDNGDWSTFLLPKATYNNDPSHGWFTEWPRIREIGNNELMMDMHGMFYDFPKTFSSSNSAGIRPIASHLRYLPDFCSWNGQIVLASDESSIQGNPMTGQPQSNLWFGKKNDFLEWGPASGYGAIYLKDSVQAGQISNPYLFAGFSQRIAHFINHGNNTTQLTIELDENGTGKWKIYKVVKLNAGAYEPIIFPADLKAEWIRIRTSENAVLTAEFHYTTDKFIDGSKYANLFKGLADIDYKKNIITGKMYENKVNYNMSCFSNIYKNGKLNKPKEYEFTKMNFDFSKGITDTLANIVLDTKVFYAATSQFYVTKHVKDSLKSLWSVDDASVILHTKNGNLRLPKGNPLFDKHMNSRSVREIVSEREIANIHGTFYELPLYKVGMEPLFEMMRPISSHNKFIDDFNTWNGLLALTGIEQNAMNSNHIYKNKSKNAAVWLGSIDDLWKFGKPVGIGGPWKNTKVNANQLSDPYLMTGYDKKTLKLIADKDVTITIWLDIAHYLNENVKYKEIQLQAGKEVIYEFPKGFSAHWAQLSTDKDCNATATFVYQ